MRELLITPQFQKDSKKIPEDILEHASMVLLRLRKNPLSILRRLSSEFLQASWFSLFAFYPKCSGCKLFPRRCKYDCQGFPDDRAVACVFVRQDFVGSQFSSGIHSISITSRK